MLQKAKIEGKIVEFENTEFKLERGYLRYIGNGKNIKNPKGNISCYRMFEEYPGEKLDLSQFDTSNVKYMSYMFFDCTNLQQLDLSSFDTSKVEDMGYMFYGCKKLQQLDLTSFDTSNVKDMSYMFDDCLSLQQLDLSSFNTSKVEDMLSMFDGCKSLQQLDVSSFDTSKVKNMNGMFYECYSLQQLNLQSFDTSNVESMNSIFYGCKNLLEIDLSSFCRLTDYQIEDLLDCLEDQHNRLTIVGSRSTNTLEEYCMDRGIRYVIKDTTPDDLVSFIKRTMEPKDLSQFHMINSNISNYTIGELQNILLSNNYSIEEINEVIVEYIGDKFIEVGTCK